MTSEEMHLWLDFLRLLPLTVKRSALLFPLFFTTAKKDRSKSSLPPRLNSVLNTLFAETSVIYASLPISDLPFTAITGSIS